MEELLSRYLISFDTAHLPHLFTDVLIMGAGVAGLRAAIETAPHLQTCLVTKGDVLNSNTYFSQGGIAFPLGLNEAVTEHIRDTLRVGQGLCDSKIVSYVVREGKRCFEELIHFGIHFNKRQGRFHNRGNMYDLALEGGHSRPRIVHHGDETGKELQKTLLSKVRTYPSFTLFEHTWIIDLLCDHGTCLGALVWNTDRGLFVVRAGAVILASGGCGQVFRESTNASTVAGDGYALAARAGALLQDMEFVQFHPTCFYLAGAARSLISETVRGEGAFLIDRKGNRFMKEYHPDGDLAPRDILSRAITQHMAIRGESNVYLDLRMFSPGRLRERFPGLYTLCRKFNLDPARDPVPVRPAAHYFIGGIKINQKTQTSIRNLYACGEVACSGFHGANRLGSNSLLEGLVFGRVAGREVHGRFRRKSRQALKIRYRRFSRTFDGNVEDIRNSVRSLMSRYVGVIRERAGLQNALNQLHFWGRYVLSTEFSDPAGWELQNMILVSWLISHSALRREESRGVHYRCDFPKPSPRWVKKHLQVQLDIGAKS